MIPEHPLDPPERFRASYGGGSYVVRLSSPRLRIPLRRRPGSALDAEGRWIELPNLRDYLLDKPSLGDRLEALRSQLTPDEIRHSIFGLFPA
jgi:hypothetical protein